MEMSGQLHSPAALLLVKSRWARLGVLHNQCGHYGEEKNVLPLLGIELQPSSLARRYTDWAIPDPSK
jgi:hypothetical protein